MTGESVEGLSAVAISNAGKEEAPVKYSRNSARKQRRRKEAAGESERFVVKN